MMTLQAVELECTRGDRALISDLSFRLAPGELLHVVGRNGSGKTTLLRTLCGLSRPSVGKICWQGENIDRLGEEYHRQLAYVGHNDAIQGELTPEENLGIAARLNGSSRQAYVRAALERVALVGFSALPSKLLSQGQRRRLALARLLVTNRALWILDEPFSGLDAVSVTAFEQVLAEHLANDGLVVITSHRDHAWRAKTVSRISLDA